jgi:hypothetical protein
MTAARKEKRSEKEAAYGKVLDEMNDLSKKYPEDNTFRQSN